MTHQPAVEDILKAFDEYDGGRITRSQFVAVVDTSVAAAYTAGRDDEVALRLQDEDDEIIFETDVDLNEEDEDADDEG